MIKIFPFHNFIFTKFFDREKNWYMRVTDEIDSKWDYIFLWDGFRDIIWASILKSSLEETMVPLLLSFHTPMEYSTWNMGISTGSPKPLNPKEDKINTCIDQILILQRYKNRNHSSCINVPQMIPIIILSCRAYLKIFKGLTFLNIPMEQVVKKWNGTLKKKNKSHTSYKNPCDKTSFELKLSQTPYKFYFVPETPFFFLSILRLLQTFRYERLIWLT